MSPQQLDRLRSILASAIQVPAQGRAEFLASECGNDEGLRAEVEALLSIHHSAGDFLSHNLPELLSEGSKGKAELSVGTVLKQRYRIERRMAQSSFATVYFATDELLGQTPVVVKVLDQISDAAVLEEMFASELQALSQVRHPNVVGISDIGKLDDGIPFLVLEFVPGATLREILRRGPVPRHLARAILRGIGRALSAAHRADVWHLDIKPENVIVFEPGSDEERVKLIDFGIARLKSLNGAGTLSGGSPNYMAPEQEERPSAACDLYALSLVAFELFTGHRPRDRQEIAAQLSKDLGTKTAQAIIKGLDAVPENRFAEVSACVEALVTEPAKKQWGIYAAVATVLAIVATAFFLTKEPASTRQKPEYSKPFPLLASSSNELHPAFSPDGQAIYFTRGDIGKGDIYKKVILSGELVPVVAGPTNDEVPQVSPDGKTLAFIRRLEKAELIAKNLLNGTEEVLSRGVAVDTFTNYSWSADGARIVVANVSNGLQTLRVVNVQTKTIQGLKLPEVPDCGLEHPSLSPDGKLLAFACRWAQGSADLFVSQVSANLDPIGTSRRITHRKDRITSVQWTPDSKSILYVGGPIGRGSLWRVAPLENSSPVRVTSEMERIETVTVARRNWKVAYSQDFSNPSIWQYRIGTELPQQLVTSSGGDGEGLLSPDGKMLLFGSGRSGTVQIWLAAADGSRPTQLTNFAEADLVIAIWSADSKSAIVTVRSKDVGHRIYAIPVSGGSAPTPLIDGGLAISVSRDGNWLYFAKVMGRKRSIWRTEYAKSLTSELIAERGEFGMESTDGKSFYFSTGTVSEGVWVKPLPRGPAKRVVESLTRRNLFSVGNNGITYIAPVPGAEHPALFFKQFHPPAATKVLLRFAYDIDWGLSLSPDEQTVVFSRELENYDVALIEQFR